MVIDRYKKCLRSNYANEIMSVDKTCSFSVILNENCGPTRGEEKIIFLHECVHEISNHLCRCHLSRENVTEIDLSATGKVKDV